MSVEIDDSRLLGPLAATENAPMRRLFDYWWSKRQGGRLPSRRHIDPTEIPRLLSCLMLVDVLSGSPPRFRFRLSGTRIVAVEGEHRGKTLDQIIPPKRLPEIVRQYADACRGTLYLRDSSLHWQDRPHVDYTVLLLPLAEDGETVDGLIGYCRYHNV